MTITDANPAVESDIVVRRPRWVFPDDLDEIFPGEDLSEECSRVAISLTLPHLEPYLIRTLRAALPVLDDPELAADVRAFCAQEAQHHRNHARVNEKVRELLGPETAARLLAVEERLSADYRRFSDQRSLRFNVGYAEGFEAMTCAMAVTRLGAPLPDGTPGPWQQLWAWHLAEEIEHRTVAFDVFEAVSGNYPYRVAVAAVAQLHFLRTLDELHKILMDHHGGRSPGFHVPSMLRQASRRYVRTFLPWYDPAAIEPPAVVGQLLAAFAPAADADVSP